MQTQTLPKFSVIGISVRTTNENNQASHDITALWSDFMENRITGKIPDKIDNTIYCIYTDYEKDHTKPYTTLLGCRVSSLDNIPEGMTGKTFDESVYHKYTAKGSLLEGIVFDAWVNIWKSDLPRAFTADFEIYSDKAQNPEDAEIDIYIAVK